ncbi:cytochrome c [Aquabacterium sp. CECT 9606]|uniref:c-type cytochrome n=1 Tax=Aquabacterium sp. CECT 9606 TaxID=2845822 RepID=UPI001E393B24|nr:cytochrome c [Aquabacterium sp. CECT 9606]CAH0348355.1 Alcohol dehydrogenase (quinone), cytochrome c subunit [Aquabacterium sp. CECT 9606]
MKRALAALLCLGLALAAAIYALNVRGEDPISAGPPGPASAQLIASGAYLARTGNCMACHTARGGAPYAGGLGIQTPFGTVFTSNLTPDAQTGIGAWSSSEFWRAMHNGRSRDGRLLYPAFPYPNYTHVTRADSDAIFAYLQSLPAVAQANRPHELRFPYNSTLALAAWRALFFKPGQFEPDTRQSADWNRGAYLVQGLGHCNACHASRNALGATSGTLDLSGGLIPVQNWYAPSLTSRHEAGVAEWRLADIIELLKSGVSAQGTVVGPMAEVVLNSTQHWTDADLLAMATYLKALPPSQDVREPPNIPPPLPDSRGAKLYKVHCAQCHGEQGEGVPKAYPALAGNRTVTMASSANLVRMVLAGGFAPSTAGNPRPYGMPPFATVFSNDDTAAVVSYIRSAWGNQAQAVSTLDVIQLRNGLQY